MPAKINIGGGAKDVVGLRINSGGTSREVLRLLLNVGGVPKEVYSSKKYEGAITVGYNSAFGIESVGFNAVGIYPYGSVSPAYSSGAVVSQFNATKNSSILVSINSPSLDVPTLLSIVGTWRKAVFGSFIVDFTNTSYVVERSAIEDALNPGINRGMVSVKDAALATALFNYLNPYRGQQVPVRIE